MDRQRDSAISGYTNGTASTDPEADRPSNESTGNARGGKEATDKLSTHQFIYLFILDGLGALVLSGGINFAIAYAVLVNRDLRKGGIRPIGFIAEPTSALLRWFLMLDNEKQSSDGEKPSKRGNVKRGAASLLQQAPRVLVIILIDTIRKGCT
ncbi:hypothetical protein HYQ46_010682 [Verticillium longisporum]|nr:hypothetical protein HYQ46_010682 [Verticillium longisporum]